MSDTSHKTQGKIAVVGAGTMGAGIASVFAALGWQVALYSRSQATLDTARTIVEAGTGSAEAPVFYTTSLNACLKDADVVSENLTEDPELKKTVLREIEQQVPATCLLSTNTSSVPITQLATALNSPQRLIGIHWFNPPQIMPLVEIVPGEVTSEEIIVQAQALSKKAGKSSIIVRQDCPGFVVNRLQYAMLREALFLVEQGIASIADVDLAVESTLAPRWAACGPLRLMDMAGLDTVRNVSAILMPELSNDPHIPALVTQLVSEGALGTKTGRGFYPWTEQIATSARNKRDRMVVHARKVASND
ncbi:3-hydroxyacyl-CoA dehydrogenase family protein [Acetobacter sp.]|jgi:3-hydroxybutyryl-CoA dehydrogenase|uniref:3-hydroxyacyl-CoA dehydrogenase family protein n=1 Tax=Acetobacter sp. TaxID=440 RepID=UPI0025BAB93B|nr:3-hydroxyacyl-CoA dehydrogenase family protein [Acetobacter sp.]MCH4089789.1 3-hydroxyacyl-CoA dehydrogenase family protein [Acetobacter sp.]MCI1298485.1 3-hydroxyacyl-CoA dehydrogenase family protein [Acetobacter sp.]